MQLNTFQKNFLFTLASLSIICGIVCGGYFGYTYLKEKREAARVLDIELRVRRIMEYSICGKLSDTEKDRLERVKLNPTETKNVLVRIHKERANFWSSTIDEISKKRDYLNQSGGASRYWDYHAAITRFENDTSEAEDQMLSYLRAAEKIEHHDPSQPLELPKKTNNSTKA